MVAVLWLRHLASLGLVWILAAKAINIVRADCAAGSSTLTTEGCSACDDYDLCRGFTSPGDCLGPNCKTNGSCTFECLSVNNSSTMLIVLVELGDYQSEEEAATGGYNDSDLANYPDETSEWPSVSNNEVSSFGTIDLSSKVSTFIVSGGSAVSEYPKGKVSRIWLTSGFISLETEVTKVVLQNLDIGTQINLLPDYLPSSVKTLDLSNTLLAAFPTELGDIPPLQRLLLDYNYLTALGTGDVIESLTTLSLENNNIDTFESVFPSLEYLYLGRNNLTRIPTAVYNHSNLKTLNVAGNA